MLLAYCRVRSCHLRPKLYRSITTKDRAAKRRSKLPLFVAGGALYTCSIYLGYTLYSIYRAPIPSDAQDNLLSSAPEVYNSIAATYDGCVGLDETLMGLGWIRAWACKDVKGDVLETSCGTGRNMNFYQLDKIQSITFVDQSAEMLEVARQKWSRSTKKVPENMRVTFKDQPLEGLSPSREQYDTVLQTFGLCSVADPTSYLAHLASFTRATGQIILVEHGRSDYAWLNKILDTSVKRHAQKWGCYYNRDINRIVEACKDVEIVSLKRYHFGTTYVYHLRPCQ